MSFTLDTREFEKALQVRMTLTNKDAAAVLNDRAGDVCMRAIKYTPRADKAAIEASLTKDYGRGAGEGARIYRNQYGTFSARSSRKKASRFSIVYLMIAKFLRTGKLGKHRRVIPLWLTEARGRKNNAAQIATLATRFIGRAKASANYIAAGFIKAAKAFGKRVALKVSEKGLAGKGEGLKASQSNLSAELTNATRGAVEIGGDALQKAVDEVTRDMQQHDAAKILKSWL